MVSADSFMPLLFAASAVLLLAVGCSAGTGDGPASEFVVSAAASAPDEPETDATSGEPPAQESTTSTTATTDTAPATTALQGGDELVDVVAAVDGEVPDGCCDRGVSALEFVVSGEAVTLTREEIDAARPADPRIGLENADYVTFDGGAYLSAPNVARFDCFERRYTLFFAGSGINGLVESLSLATGCSRVSVSAPTECLGLMNDPSACGDTPRAAEQTSIWSCCERRGPAEKGSCPALLQLTFVVCV